MRELPLNALRAFAAIYETGGIRPAARFLQVTHSSISRHLRELEGWIGLALIEKAVGSRTLIFTPQGEALGRASLAALRELDQAVTSLREARRGNSLTISTTPSFAARWLLPRLPAFEDTYPWIEVSVVVDQRLADPADHGADLAIRMGRGPWKGLACEPLMDDVLFPVISSDYWHQMGKPNTPDALSRMRLLHDRDPQASWQAWLAHHPVDSIDARKGPRFASSDLVLRAASQGLGAALARGRLAVDDIENGVLLRPFVDKEIVLTNAYWIVRAENAPERVAVAAFVDWLRQ